MTLVPSSRKRIPHRLMDIGQNYLYRANVECSVVVVCFDLNRQHQQQKRTKSVGTICSRVFRREKLVKMRWRLEIRQGPPKAYSALQTA